VGWLVGKGCDRGGKGHVNATRWKEVRVYETERGGWIGEVVLRTLWEAERNETEAVQSETFHGLVDELRNADDGILSEAAMNAILDAIHQDYRLGDHFAEKAAV
jgi:hypothetical protein